MTEDHEAMERALEAGGIVSPERLHGAIAEGAAAVPVPAGSDD